MLCLFCNNEEGVKCDNNCKIVLDAIHDNVISQRDKYNSIMNKHPTCKDCGAKRKKYTQYCTSCAKKRETERRRRHELKKRKKRICRNENCDNEIINPKSNSQRYCCEECKPTYQTMLKYKLKRIENAKKTKLISKEYDKYEGTVDMKWIQPRGSKKRKEMGLEASKFGLAKDSDTCGRFVY